MATYEHCVEYVMSFSYDELSSQYTCLSHSTLPIPSTKTEVRYKLYGIVLAIDKQTLKNELGNIPMILPITIESCGNFSARTVAFEMRDSPLDTACVYSYVCYSNESNYVNCDPVNFKFSLRVSVSDTYTLKKHLSGKLVFIPYLNNKPLESLFLPMSLDWNCNSKFMAFHPATQRTRAVLCETNLSEVNQTMEFTSASLQSAFGSLSINNENASTSGLADPLCTQDMERPIMTVAELFQEDPSKRNHYSNRGSTRFNGSTTDVPVISDGSNFVLNGMEGLGNAQYQS